MNILKRKKGAEVIEVLIIIAIMGVLAVTSVMAIGNNISKKTEGVNTKLDEQLERAHGFEGVKTPVTP